jgi:DNA adenine methylase
VRPVLRYHGGKWRLVPWIISHFPRHRVYVEPYCGAASVLMRKPRTYSEVINDLDGEIVSLFRVLRDTERSAELQRLLELTPFARTEFEQAYNFTLDPIERARRTIVKAYMGFGSAAVTQKSPTSPGAGFKPTTGFRANSNKSGTTPAHDWANFPKFLPAFTDRLRGVVIENRPALEIIAQHDSPETLHYVDPPYVHVTRRAKDWRTPQAYRHEMSDADHAALADVLKGVSGMVVLSGYPSPLYDELFGSWKRIDKDAHADGARDRVECLWLSPATADAFQPLLIEVPA